MFRDDEQEFAQFQADVILEDQTNVVKMLAQTAMRLKRRIAVLEAQPQFAVEIKTDTGDYAAGNSWEGRYVLNTFDNNIKMFADGAWRQIIAY